MAPNNGGALFRTEDEDEEAPVPNVNAFPLLTGFVGFAGVLFAENENVLFELLIDVGFGGTILPNVGFGASPEGGTANVKPPVVEDRFVFDCNDVFKFPDPNDAIPLEFVVKAVLEVVEDAKLNVLFC